MKKTRLGLLLLVLGLFALAASRPSGGGACRTGCSPEAVLLAPPEPLALSAFKKSRG